MSIIYAIDIYRLQNHETAKQLGVDAPKRSPGSESRCHAVYPAMPGSSVATTGIDSGISPWIENHWDQKPWLGDIPRHGVHCQVARFTIC